MFRRSCSAPVPAMQFIGSPPLQPPVQRSRGASERRRWDETEDAADDEGGSGMRVWHPKGSSGCPAQIEIKNIQKMYKKP